MKVLVETSDNKFLDLSPDLALSLKLAMDIYYETVHSISIKKKVQGTIEPILTKKFKGKGFFIKNNISDKSTDNIKEITLIEVSSFGVELRLKGTKETICVSYDSLEMAIKEAK